jgi:hypothetical protein
MAQVLVRGTVVDQTGESVIGASIQVKGTTQGTITDIDGKLAYVPFNCNNRIIKATLVPYPQARKGNRYLITKDSI